VPGRPGRQVRAAVFSGPGQPVRVTGVDLAPPGAGEVEVVIAAAGVCHSDLHIVLGEWQHPVPVVLGHEGSGVVAAVGPGVTSLSPGDHVVLSWVPACATWTWTRWCRPAARWARPPRRSRISAQAVYFASC
jgi:S-(hydroxymethyl)glutathione dehydrogenase / alcohol dehydrogenase